MDGEHCKHNPDPQTQVFLPIPKFHAIPIQVIFEYLGIKGQPMTCSYDISEFHRHNKGTAALWP